jgi:hypothetical protein
MSEPLDPELEAKAQELAARIKARPHGEVAEGRMAYVGMVFNPLPDPERVFEGLPKPGVSMRAR